uniref:IQ motif containing with AAA domain 1 n=1 Tax=Molossus molossus TaxID=27622 RepID=A0A7J8FRY6_MOLMO|nr:IQ motif containing with AAA domain 1 [Molossus molossus]
MSVSGVTRGPFCGRRHRKQKEKKGKKGKKGKFKDLTGDRTIESLYQELVQEGLLMQVLKVGLSDYIGEYSYLGTTLRRVSIEPMPSLLDVRQLVTLYGILPLGSQAVHEKAPLVKSLLLAGPAGVGKKMLVHAICSETGANLFNLSAANIAGKYPGKGGLDLMLQMVLKMSALGLAFHFVGAVYLTCEPRRGCPDPTRSAGFSPRTVKPCPGVHHGEGCSIFLVVILSLGEAPCP